MLSRHRIVRSITTSSALILLVALSACYHATVETGRRPSGEVIQRRWAHSFIRGLVPPSTVETAAQCPNGVARVETQLSFLNMLANIITFGIYTPMHITVHCAAPGTALRPVEDGERVIALPTGSSLSDLQSALNAAAARAAEDREPVFVTFSNLE